MTDILTACQQIEEAVKALREAHELDAEDIMAAVDRIREEELTCLKN